MIFVSYSPWSSSLYFLIKSTKKLFTRTLHYSFLYLVHKGTEIHYQMEMSQSLSVTNVWSLANGAVMSLKWVLDKVPIDLLISLLQVLWELGKRKSIGWLRCAILILSYTCKNCIWLIKLTIQKHCLQKFIMEMTWRPLNWSTRLSPILSFYLPFQF